MNEGRTERQIAEALNAEGYRTDLNRQWTRATVHQVLTNEKYIGNNVFSKVSFTQEFTFFNDRRFRVEFFRNDK